MATPSSVKSQASALVTFVEQIRDKLTDTLDIAQYQPLYDDLKSSLADLQLNQLSIHDQMSQDAQEEVLVNINIAKNWQAKLLERIHSLTVNQQASATTTNKKRHAKLPEIKLLTFSGNFDEWETFWGSFYNNVDSRNDLEQSAIAYLLQSLEGEPREMIKGLSHTDDNYIIAVTALQDRYVDPVKQTEALLQKFFNLPSPHHNAKELRKFLTEYHKVREQMRHVEDFDASAVTIRSVLIHKLSYQTFSEISDHVKNHNFSLQEMDSTLQYIIGKLEHAHIVLGDKTNVKLVGTHSQQNQGQGGILKCPFCSGDHKAVDCNKYKSIQASKDRVISQQMCFNGLTPGHPSKNCRSKKTCRICHLYHHTSLCNQSQLQQSSGDTSQPSKSNQSSSSSRGSQQQQQHPHHKQAQNHQQPVVTQHKSNTQKQHAPSTTTSAHVTNINVSNFPHNVLPTETLNVSYCHAKTFTRAFFDTGSQRSNKQRGRRASTQRRIDYKRT